jgi:hypothetical protein
MAHRSGPVTAPPQRDAKVVMRRRVAVVEPQGRLVVGDRIVDGAFLEEHVPDVHDRPDGPLVERERLRQQSGRGGAVAGTNRLDRALVEDADGIIVEHSPATLC